MNSTHAFTRNEITQALIKMTIFSVATYFTFKWMMKHLDPTNKNKKNAAKKAQKLLTKLGIKDKELSEYEMMIASHLVDPSEITVSWDSIGGLENVIKEIKETVIFPIRRRDLFSDSHLTQPPKGVLLHGPPGCGKTMIAKATAKEAGTRFINLDVSILTDKWYGESQKLAAAVFSLAIKLQPCIIFIDEIDSFLRNRSLQDHEATAMMKAQFMTLWDGLSTDSSCTVIVMGATNRPLDLDRAIIRRMPATFHIPLPDFTQRKEILSLILKGEPTADNVNVVQLAKDSEGLSGAELKELCRSASLYRVKDYMRTNPLRSNFGTRNESEAGRLDFDEQEEFHDTLRPITMEDLTSSLRKMKDSKVQTSTLATD